MDRDATYRIKGPEVIAETIDGETIIINLEDGNYYSLNAAGGEVWNLIDGARSLNAIASMLRPPPPRCSSGSRRRGRKVCRTVAERESDPVRISGRRYLRSRDRGSRAATTGRRNSGRRSKSTKTCRTSSAWTPFMMWAKPAGQ